MAPGTSIQQRSADLETGRIKNLFALRMSVTPLQPLLMLQCPGGRTIIICSCCVLSIVLGHTWHLRRLLSNDLQKVRM